MKTHLLPLILVLALLAGCTPNPKPSPSPTPEPDPTPVAGMDFDAFLGEVNARRKAVIETEAPLDISAWTPDFTQQNDTYTEEEMDLLLTPHDLAEPLTLATAQEAIGAFLTLLRTTIEPYRVYLYYVPGLYLSEAEGLDPDYVKPTIGPEGQICYGFYALSHDGSDLPHTLGDYDLDWTQAERSTRGSEVFTEYSYQDIPVLQSTQMYASTPEQEAQLERFAACGGEYADEPVLIFDVRANPGGSDRWIMNWFEGFAEQQAEPKCVYGHRYSQLSCRTISYPADRMGTWGISEKQGTWVPRESVALLLTDKGTASSGETAVKYFHTMENVLAIGAPSSGCDLVSNNCEVYLPNTGIPIFFGTGLSFCETLNNRDGMGYLPDLWVNPPDALDAAARLCDYYGLK